MSGVPEHHGLMRAALVGSLMIHLALAFLPWGGLLGGEGDESPGDGNFEVSLIPGVAGGGEIPGAPAETVDPPIEAVSEPEPVDSPEPERVETAEPEPEPTGAATPGGGGGNAPGEDPEGGSATGLDAPPAPYRPPRLLVAVLPIDPDDSEDLDVPAEIPVRLRVGKDGKVKEIIPSNPDLPPQVMEALERSARAMKFLPARRGDQFVEAWYHMTFGYRK